MSTNNLLSTTESFNNIRMILVNTSHPGNIGAVARAMKNMGLSQLYLVQPEHFPDERATRRAAGAVNVLEQAVIVDTLAAAVADCALVVGTSARDRRIPWPLLNPREAAAQVVPIAAHQPVAVVFGREASGLSNDELQCCHLHVNIPADEAYSSLNIAMAAQVISYELRMALIVGELTSDSMAQWDRPLATANDLERYFAHLEETLTAIGFLKPHAPKQLMPRLRRLYQRARLDDTEVSLLRGILTATQHQGTCHQ